MRVLGDSTSVSGQECLNGYYCYAKVTEFCPSLTLRTLHRESTSSTDIHAQDCRLYGGPTHTSSPSGLGKLLFPKISGIAWSSIHFLTDPISRAFVPRIEVCEGVRQLLDPVVRDDTHLCVAHDVLAEHLDAVFCS